MRAKGSVGRAERPGLETPGGWIETGNNALLPGAGISEVGLLLPRREEGK